MYSHAAGQDMGRPLMNASRWHRPEARIPATSTPTCMIATRTVLRMVNMMPREVSGLRLRRAESVVQRIFPGGWGPLPFGNSAIIFFGPTAERDVNGNQEDGDPAERDAKYEIRELIDRMTE